MHAKGAWYLHPPCSDGSLVITEGSSQKDIPNPMAPYTMNSITFILNIGGESNTITPQVTRAPLILMSTMWDSALSKFNACRRNRVHAASLQILDLSSRHVSMCIQLVHCRALSPLQRPLSRSLPRSFPAATPTLSPRCAGPCQAVVRWLGESTDLAELLHCVLLWTGTSSTFLFKALRVLHGFVGCML